MKRVLTILFALFLVAQLDAQTTLKGKITDEKTGEELIGAAIQVKGTKNAALTDLNGNYSLNIKQPLPVVVVVAYLGYDSKEVNVAAASNKFNIELGSNAVQMGEVQVRGKRITAKQQQQALSVETMDVLAIKEAPSGDFYESLGNLKGVDVTSASMGFKVINTRGFNSTSPVRSLQVIDGVDNQSPGLNFSLGNFLGAPDLDVKSVDIVAGASSAFYGPGAFNGVVDMRTKTPWLFPGLSFEKKFGSRGLSQFSLRWADIIKNKEGKEKFAYKFNIFRMSARDWEAQNYDPVTDSEDDATNFGGYDAVNIYGDEVQSGGNTYGILGDFGEGRIYRPGYRESDIVDYDTENVKTNIGLYYKFNPKVELEYCFGYSTGTTVYQGENRFSLKNIQFNQHKLELRKDSTFFIRAYRTAENAGDSYDAVLTAFLMSDAQKPEVEYYKDFKAFYAQQILGQIENAGLPEVPFPDLAQLQADCDCPEEWPDVFSQILTDYQEETETVQLQWIEDNPEIMAEFQEQVLAHTTTSTAPGSDEEPFYLPGTERYDSLFNAITSTLTTEGGSRFYDRSSLYHLHGEYQKRYKGIQMTLGSNGRVYTPDSRGTIFDETKLEEMPIFGRAVWEMGVYAGAKYKFLDDKFTSTGTVRFDKSQNFDGVVSPALSLVYAPNVNHSVRTSYSTALRNPTLSDQYLNLDVGRAILIGNIDGVDSLYTVDSFVESISGNTQNFELLEELPVDPITPERAKTLEVGYRGLFNNKFFLDVSAYHSWYEDFIGYKLGVDVKFSPGQLESVQAFRAAANAVDRVTTKGANVGVNYYLGNNYVLNANTSYNELDLGGSTDPLIPAFNTPKLKYNLGISARRLKTDLGFFTIENWGFGINYKWIEGYTFEGSPQFTGFVPTYDLVDAQVNYTFEKYHTNIKIGASNLLNNESFQVYGGPRIGRFGYFSISYEFIDR